MGLGLSTALSQGHWGQKERVYKAQSTRPRVISLAWYSTGGGTCRKRGAWPMATTGRNRERAKPSLLAGALQSS